MDWIGLSWVGLLVWLEFPIYWKFTLWLNYHSLDCVFCIFHMIHWMPEWINWVWKLIYHSNTLKAKRIDYWLLHTIILMNSHPSIHSSQVHLSFPRLDFFLPWLDASIINLFMCQLSSMSLSLELAELRLPFY